MLVLILIDVHYSETTVFSPEKGSNRQSHSSSGSHHPVKNFPHECSLLFDTKSGKLLFRWKRTVTLCWNLSSEHLLTNTFLTKWLGQIVELHTVMQHFGKLVVSVNGPVVKLLDSQSNQESRFQSHWVDPRLTQSFILLRLIKWVAEILGKLSCYKLNCLLKVTLTLRQLKTIHKKGP